MAIRHAPYLTLMLLLSGVSFAHAQAVEAVPLSAPSYTLNKETDPMATDAGAPPEKTINRGTVEIAPPPPGADDQAGTSTHDTMPSPTTPPSDFAPADTSPPAPVADTPSASFPNNNVSGVVPKDESKFENRTFCTLKVTFNAKGNALDKKTAEKIKTYLDTNADKLTYKRAEFGKKGEFDYCIDIPQHNFRSKIYTGLKRLLPPKDSNDTRTVLVGKGFTRVQNSM